MEEMMEETLDSVNEDDELEEEADAEVDKVLFELTDGKLGQAGRVGAELPVRPLFTSKINRADTNRHRRRMKMKMRRKLRKCGERCRSCLVGRLDGLGWTGFCEMR
jgi:hypothetical protein